MTLTEVEGVQYELFDINELHEMAVMTAEAFSRYEPVTSALGISVEDFTDFVKLLGPKVEYEELTVIARSQDTKQIIGAMIADDFAIEQPEEIRRLGDKFEPVWAILDELDTRYKQGMVFPKGKYLHLLLGAVNHQHNGKNIAKNLIKICLENGVRKGYKRGFGEATGVVSQHILRKFGFVDCFEIPYKTFSFQGRKVFESIKVHHSIILMDKALV